MNKKRPQYHHGDLRAALLKVAAKMIAEQGIESLTLRALSERIGVSRTAPYRHFVDKSALLAAVAEEGFNRLFKKIQTAMQQAEADTIDQFQKMGVAYVQFAIDNPTHYRLMLTCETDSHDIYPDLEKAGEKVFDLLVETIKKGQTEKKFKPGDPLNLAYVVWAAVHGLAALMIDAQIHHEVDIEGLANFTTRTVVEGMLPR